VADKPRRTGVPLRSSRHHGVSLFVCGLLVIFAARQLLAYAGAHKDSEVILARAASSIVNRSRRDATTSDEVRAAASS
jgi:hypothetical protein